MTRNTRGISPTEAGQRLLDRLAPEFDEIEAEIQGLTELRDSPTASFEGNSVNPEAMYNKKGLIRVDIIKHTRNDLKNRQLALVRLDFVNSRSKIQSPSMRF